MAAISKRDYTRTKLFLESGGRYENDVLDYVIYISDNGDRIFYHKGRYKKFKTEEDFFHAATRTTKHITSSGVE